MPNERSAARDEGGAARRPDVGNTDKQASGETGAGQEAAKGKAPGEHTREHQSNYGGGGENGGASGDASGDANVGTARDDRDDRDSGSQAPKS